MIVGILKERFDGEGRVALSPFGVESVVGAGASVIVEHDAGAIARFDDEQYQKSGATIVYSPEEAVGRADIVLKVMPPIREEFGYFVDGQMLLSFLLLGMGRRPFVDMLLEKNITAAGMELLRGSGGGFPILRLMSEISGQIAALAAARYLRSDQGGRGVLLGGVPGVAPAAVVILGVGASGFAAAQTAIGLGAQLILLDNDIERLREADLYFGKRCTTVIASPENIRRGVSIADIFIGAISINEETGHHLVSEEMVKTMKPGAVIIDISINQGGCVETSRPTTIREPIFEKHGVIHYCVPNMPAMVARTSTYALTNALIPFVQQLVTSGVEGAIQSDEYLRCGIVTHRGVPTHRMLEDIYGIPAQPLDCNC